jgi:hypothetical protein
MNNIKVHKSGEFTVMSNHHLQDKEMSLKAKGILSIMLSLPKEWDYSVAGLKTLSKDGKDCTTSALVELEKLGYLVRKRAVDEKGRFAGYNYDIYEKPQTGQPLTGKPPTDNPPQYNINQSNTDKSNIKNIKKESKTTYDEIIQESGFNETVQQSLCEFIKMRKLIKKPLTDRALTNIIARLKRLSKGNNETADKILNQSIENAWQGIYEIKTSNQEKEDTGQNGNELWNELVLAVNEIKTTLVQEYAGCPFRTPLYELKDKSRCKPIYDKLPFEVKQVVDFGTFVLYGGLDERSMMVERNRFLKAMSNR